MLIYVIYIFIVIFIYDVQVIKVHLHPFKFVNKKCISLFNTQGLQGEQLSSRCSYPE